MKNASQNGLARFVSTFALLASLGLIAASVPGFSAQEQAGGLSPTPLRGLAYTNEFFPGARYRPGVPTQERILGFANGAKAASASEITECLRAWGEAAPDRTRLVEYARSHENRPLHYLVVTAPENMERLEEIRSGVARLGDPRKLSAEEAEALAKKSPAVAWLGFTIHGDETEGSDAALALLYHLVAAENEEVTKLLKRVVVIVDPLMNPDGRDRFIKMVAENRGTSPNVDSQSLLHAGYWPRGRGNHYLFDLNRDSILGVHPETRGRLRELNRWNPQLFVDGHGMGALNTHLFSPPREPINKNIPAERARWAEMFARDQSRAFDREKLVYYTGEWNEEWYPGYMNAWASYRGAIGILYEQARVAEDGVRRPEGRILSYRESVRHHVIGAMANLTTLSEHREELLQYFYETRRSALASDGPYANRMFAVLPTANESRMRDLVSLLELQGLDLFRAGEGFTAPAATDQLGRPLKDVSVPPGALLIPARQPLGRLATAILEFDPRFSRDVLEKERREVLRTGRSRIYDVTAWNLTMLFGLDAWTLDMGLPAEAKPWSDDAGAPKNMPETGRQVVGWILDGADDRSVAAAARMMEQGVEVRVAEKPLQFDGRDYVRGSVVVTVLDNRDFAGDLRKTVTETSAALALEVAGIESGLGEGDLPDLGGEHFQRLEPPRIAVLTRGSFSSQDFGSTWYVLDKHLGIRHSHLEEGRAGDLSRYNVIVAPDRGGEALPSDVVSALKEWVKAGGTLIAVGNSAASFTPAKAEFSKVRLLPDVLDKLPEYELAILREWQAWKGDLPGDKELWAHTASVGMKYPWPAGGASPELKELKARDAWQKLFMPEGTFLAGRTDTNHWLTAGCGEWLPLLVGNDPVLMSATGVEAAIRYGYWTEVETNQAASELDKPEAEKTKAGEKAEGKSVPRIGWCVPPEGAQLHLRMSGLLWPEAAQRLANAAGVTRESLGRGQVILFASPPTFRASMRGTMRVFENALVYGPGFGATQPIRP